MAEGERKLVKYNDKIKKEHVLSVSAGKGTKKENRNMKSATEQ